MITPENINLPHASAFRLYHYISLCAAEINLIDDYINNPVVPSKLCTYLQARSDFLTSQISAARYYLKRFETLTT